MASLPVFLFLEAGENVQVVVLEQLEHGAHVIVFKDGSVVVHD